MKVSPDQSHGQTAALFRLIVISRVVPTPGSLLITKMSALGTDYWAVPFLRRIPSPATSGEASGESFLHCLFNVGYAGTVIGQLHDDCVGIEINIDDTVPGVSKRYSPPLHRDILPLF